jgi:hypothetical protein
MRYWISDRFTQNNQRDPAPARAAVMAGSEGAACREGGAAGTIAMGVTLTPSRKTDKPVLPGGTTAGRDEVWCHCRRPVAGGGAGSGPR